MLQVRPTLDWATQHRPDAVVSAGHSNQPFPSEGQPSTTNSTNSISQKQFHQNNSTETTLQKQLALTTTFRISSLGFLKSNCNFKASNNMDPNSETIDWNALPYFYDFEEQRLVSQAPRTYSRIGSNLDNLIELLVAISELPVINLRGQVDFYPETWWISFELSSPLTEYPSEYHYDLLWNMAHSGVPSFEMNRGRDLIQYRPCDNWNV